MSGDVDLIFAEGALRRAGVTGLAFTEGLHFGIVLDQALGDFAMFPLEEGRLSDAQWGGVANGSGNTFRESVAYLVGGVIRQICGE